MVFFNYALRKLNAKIVYYGPGLCGKTTNLQWIHDHFEGGHRGEMISLATEGDRTIFFDLLPLEIGKIRGLDVTLQLYTVPGQVHYNSTRQLVLKGADGVVFVGDSQRAMRVSNADSWKNLKENLLLQGVELEKFPHVLQFNKRDLRDIMSVDELDETLNEYDAPFFESVATDGIGVQETLQGIVKLVMRSLRDRYESVGRPEETSSLRAATPGAAFRGAEAPAAPVAPFRPAAPAASVAPPVGGEEFEEDAMGGSEVSEEAITHPSMPLSGQEEGERREETGPGTSQPGDWSPTEPGAVSEEPAPATDWGPSGAGMLEGEAAPSEEAPSATVSEPAPAEESAVSPVGGEEAQDGEDRDDGELAQGVPETETGTPSSGFADEPASWDRVAEASAESGIPPDMETTAPLDEVLVSAAGEQSGEPVPAVEEESGPTPEGGEDVTVVETAEVPSAGRDAPEVNPVSGDEGAPVEAVFDEPFQQPDDPGSGSEAGGTDHGTATVFGESSGTPPQPEPDAGGARAAAPEGAEEFLQRVLESPPPTPGEREEEETGPAAGSGEESEGGAAEEAVAPSAAAEVADESPAAPPVPIAPRPAEPVVFGMDDPFTFVAPGAESPLQAEASAVVAVSPAGTPAISGEEGANQLQLRIEGTRALARSGDVRELDILVPVPGSWIGNRRVTLQLRLTLMPAEEDQ